MTVVTRQATSRLGIEAALGEQFQITHTDKLTGDENTVIIVHTDALADPVADLEDVKAPVVVVTAHLDQWWLNQLADAEVAAVVSDTGTLDELGDIVQQLISAPLRRTLMDQTVKDATQDTHWARHRRIQKRVTPELRRIGQHLAMGLTDAEIAAETHKSVDTVKEQIGTLYKILLPEHKTGNKRVMAVRRLLTMGIVNLQETDYDR